MYQFVKEEVKRYKAGRIRNTQLYLYVGNLHGGVCILYNEAMRRRKSGDTVTNLETEEKEMRTFKQISLKNPHVIAKFMNKPIKA